MIKYTLKCHKKNKKYFQTLSLSLSLSLFLSLSLSLGFATADDSFIISTLDCIGSEIV
ncbi:hypothetical protein OAV88_01405 [bacterium]|nr:hypothetical protein [bacterium]